MLLLYQSLIFTKIKNKILIMKNFDLRHLFLTNGIVLELISAACICHSFAIAIPSGSQGANRGFRSGVLIVRLSSCIKNPSLKLNNKLLQNLFILKMKEK